MQPTLLSCIFMLYLRLHLLTVRRVQFIPVYRSRKEKTVCIICLSGKIDIPNLSSDCSDVFNVNVTPISDDCCIGIE